MEIALCHPTLEAIRYAPTLGCRIGYIELSWSLIQPEPGVFDFSYYDPMVQQAAELGITLIGTVASQRGLHYFPHREWWIWNNHRGMMPDPEAWQYFLTTTVARYRSVIRGWEIWPEPNCLDCNPMSYYDPALYRELLAFTSGTIRSVDPTAKLVLGGIWLNSQVQDYLEVLFEDRSIFEYFDIFSWHFYVMAQRREQIPFKIWQEPLCRLMKFFRSKLPADYPVWVTEFGLPTTTDLSKILCTSTRGGIVGMSETEQADWFTRFAQLAEDEWGIDLLVWLMLADEVNPDNPDHFSSTVGLLRTDGSEKPAAARLAQLQAANRAKRSVEQVLRV